MLDYIETLNLGNSITEFISYIMPYSVQQTIKQTLW